MEKYDVIIIGAGPGGLNCARFLVASGKRVLVLEKNPKLGIKACANGITTKCYEYLRPPAEIISRSFSKIVLETPGLRNKIDMGEPIIYTIDRHKLCNWLVCELPTDRFKILCGTAVREITNDYIVTDRDEQFGYDHLVGADGSNSLIRRHLGLPTERFELAFHYKLPLAASPDLEFHFDTDYFGSCYGWIFPHLDHVSIGTGGDPRYTSINRQNLEKWLEMKGIDYHHGIFEAAMINCDFRGYRFGRVYLLGDAAGLAAYFTGEGIYNALLSGEYIAREIGTGISQAYKINEIVKRNAFQIKLGEVLRRLGSGRNNVINFINFILKINLFARYIIKRL